MVRVRSSWDEAFNLGDGLSPVLCANQEGNHGSDFGERKNVPPSMPKADWHTQIKE